MVVTEQCNVMHHPRQWKHAFLKIDNKIRKKVYKPQNLSSQSKLNLRVQYLTDGVLHENVSFYVFVDISVL